MHPWRAPQRQRIARINRARYQRQPVARRNALFQQRRRMTTAHHPHHANERQRHAAPLQRMRPPAQHEYVHQQHRQRNQRGNNRHIDHAGAAGKGAVKHNVEQRKTAAADDQQPPGAHPQRWPVVADAGAKEERQQRRRQQPAPEGELMRRQPRLAQFAGDIAGRPKQRCQQQHHIRMRQPVGLQEFHRIESSQNHGRKWRYSCPSRFSSGCKSASQRARRRRSHKISACNSPAAR